MGHLAPPAGFILKLFLLRLIVIQNWNKKSPAFYKRSRGANIQEAPKKYAGKNNPVDKLFTAAW
jgi:hypothetical protein